MLFKVEVLFLLSNSSLKIRITRYLIISFGVIGFFPYAYSDIYIVI